MSGSQFVDELIAALQDGTVDRWRARYRTAGALIVDDVHALAGKERSQDELFHLFNALHSAGKQVVLASDRPPSEIGELEARLRSRFDGGLVVAIQPPDRTLREALYARTLQSTARRARSRASRRCWPSCRCPEPPRWSRSSTACCIPRAAAGGAITLSLVRRELELRRRRHAGVRAGRSPTSRSSTPRRS